MADAAASSGITRFVHVGLSTSDLARSTRLFEALGFDVSPPVRYQGEQLARIVGIPSAAIEVAYARGHGFEVELLHYVSPDGRRSSDLRPCDPGHAHLGFYVADLDATLARLADHGFVAAGPPEMVAAVGRRAVYAYGPDGLVLELSEVVATSGS
jgi:catechol 2,3-dioxygenase-like lactoylglutathione lyase family enzyme